MQFSCSMKAQPEVTTKNLLKKNDYPSWVLNPYVSGYLAVVGAAPIQNKNNDEWQLLAAKLNAQAKLSKQVDLYIEHSTSLKQEIIGKSFNTDIQSETTQQSIQGLDLNQAKVAKKWVSPENGILYILYLLPL